MKKIFFGVLSIVFNFGIAQAQETLDFVLEKEANIYENKSYRALKSVTLVSGFQFSATSTSIFSAKIIDEFGSHATPNFSLNNVKTSRIKIPGITSVSQIGTLTNAQIHTEISYMDGLGRPFQRIDIKSSPTEKDIVQPLVYDNRGRVSTQYLPYAESTGTGSYRVTAVASQSAFYNLGDKIAADANPYAVTHYDNSPLGVAVEQGAVGAQWQPGTGHTLRNTYRVNLNSDNVLKWSSTGPGTTYPENELAVTETTDAQGNKTLIFTDKLGKVILKQQQLDENVTENGTTTYASFIETYYVYDDMERLIYQVPPKATAKIRAGATWNDVFIDEWVFKYGYDGLGRMIERKAPGSGVVYIIYDQLDRQVMIQDANMRAAGRWMFTKYDRMHRPVLQGLYTYSELYPGSGLTAKQQLQRYYDELNYSSSGVHSYEIQSNSQIYFYTNNSFPQNNIQVLTVNFYDRYDLDGSGNQTFTYANPGLPGASSSNSANVQGLLTGTMSLIVGTTDYLTTIIFYDQYGRPIQKKSNNQIYLNAGLNDIHSMVYEGFSAVPKLVRQVKTTSPTVNIRVDNRYTYDHRDRLTAVYQANDGSAEQQISLYKYNELGQLIDKSLHAKSGGGFLQSLDFRYTIRGWLSRINNSSLSAETDDNGTADVFGMEFVYNNLVSGLTTSGAERYDGRLSAVKWKANDASSISSTPVYERSFRFAYDKSGRLKDALYSAYNGTAWNAESGGYDEKEIKYDLNGNILGLKRNFISSGSTVTQMDNLTYTYASGSGNRLTKVEDATGNANGFVNGSSTTTEYVYDDNGNLITDYNKGSGGVPMTISYNLINKNSRIDLPGGKYILYTYSATGQRLRKSAYDGTTLKVTDYIDGFVYENGTLAYFNMAEGRVRNAGGTLRYEYFIKDHQGNVRLSFEEGTGGVAKVVQENHYYPFGLSMKGAIIRTALPGMPNKNLYNAGSELQDDFGDMPNLYSTFFREYDAVLGRMIGIDPMADKYGSFSPYNYSLNDPSNLNDPTGGDPLWESYGAASDDEYSWTSVFRDEDIPWSAGEQAWMDFSYAMGDVYLGGDPYSQSSYTPDYVAVSGFTLDNPYQASSTSNSMQKADDAVIEYAAKNVRMDILSLYGFGILLPEVNITALRSGKLPSWWGKGELFVNDNVSYKIGNSGNSVGLGNETLNDFARGFMNAPESDHFSTSSYVGMIGTGLSVAEGLNKAYKYMPRTTLADLRSIDKTAKILKYTGVGVGVLGSISKAIEAGADGKITAGEVFGVVYSGASIAFPVLGFVDLGLEMFTGTSFSDRVAHGIDSAYSGPLYNFQK